VETADEGVESGERTETGAAQAEGTDGGVPDLATAGRNGSTASRRPRRRRRRNGSGATDAPDAAAS
jgi:hypothetical protein